MCLQTNAKLEFNKPILNNFMIKYIKTQNKKI